MSTHPPSIHQRAFSCPHCGAYTSQHWYELYASEKGAHGKPSTPHIPTIQTIENVKKSTKLNQEYKNNYVHWANKMISGFVFFEIEDQSKYLCSKAGNIHLSECYHCEKIAVWLHDRLIFPSNKYAIQPNPDMSDDVKSVFEEAREIVDASPRGAAALLRLAIQKICIELGEQGKNLDDDIGSLVKKGLEEKIQKALDTVRVIGNESVHPGKIDLSDDRDTAYQIFHLVNLIYEEMISRKKRINKVYKELPKEKREAIKKRDKKKD